MIIDSPNIYHSTSRLQLHSMGSPDPVGARLLQPGDAANESLRVPGQQCEQKLADESGFPG